MKNTKTNTSSTMSKLGALVVMGVTLMLGGCATNSMLKPGIEKAAKDGIFFVDLRKGPFELSHPELQKPYTNRILNENCLLPENTNNPFCKNPADYVQYTGQVSNGLGANGAQFLGILIPKNLESRSFAPPSEKDGDIVRIRVIPGPISVFIYDGVIERHDDPNRACKWEGTHNYSGGVVCPKYGYSYRDLDQSKFR